MAHRTHTRIFRQRIILVCLPCVLGQIYRTCQDMALEPSYCSKVHRRPRSPFCYRQEETSSFLRFVVTRQARPTGTAMTMSTTHPTTERMLAPHHSPSSSRSLLTRTEGKENRIEGGNALKTLSLISVNLH